MINLAEYLLKSGIVLAVLYVFYWLLLRRDTFFATNRVILIFSVVVSLIIPLISFGWMPTETVVPAFTINFEAEPTQLVNPIAANHTMQAQWGIWSWFVLIYAIGAGIVFMRLVYQAIYLHAVSRSSQTITQGNLRIVLLEKTTIPFSYFNKIFIPRTEYSEAAVDNIIEHEKSHLRQYHYIDIVIIQILTIIHWFNPFAWLIERSVKEIHEFLADKTVLRNGFDQGRYQALLVNQALGGPVFTITNQFNQSLIKKRIVMMKQIKSPSRARLKALLLVPLIAVLTLAFSGPIINVLETPPGKQVKITGKVTVKETGKYLPGVNIIINESTMGTVTNILGDYNITADSGATLVYSYVGYKTLIISFNGKTPFNVQLEPTSFTLDFNKENQFIADGNQFPVEEIDSPNGKAYVAIEAIPAYPGGTKALKHFIDTNLKYPEDAKKSKIWGKVLVNFQVDEQGNVTNVKVMKGVYPSLDAEALRVTQLIKGWKPGMQQGKPVVCQMNMPVVFKL